MTFKCFPATLLLVASIPSQAGEFSLGIAAGTQGNTLHDQGDTRFVVPVLGYEGERFSYFLDTAAWTLAGGERGDGAWRVRVLATARLFDQPDAAAGLEDRDSTLETGFEFGARGLWGSLTFGAVTDVLGRHKGYEASVGYAYEWRLSDRLTLNPGLSVSYQDEKLANYYYGVLPSEVRAGRSLYRPDSGGTFNAGLLATYGLGPRWTLVGVVQHQALSAELADSPLVEHDHSLTAVVGVMYRFE